jgi:cobalt-zinc-cadmium efflux system protein
MHNHHEHATVPKRQLPYLTGIILNTAFIIAEMIFAHYAHSTALFADALHSVSDVASLILAWPPSLFLGYERQQRTPMVGIMQPFWLVLSMPSSY